MVKSKHPDIIHMFWHAVWLPLEISCIIIRVNSHECIVLHRFAKMWTSIGTRCSPSLAVLTLPAGNPLVCFYSPLGCLKLPVGLMESRKGISSSLWLSTSVFREISCRDAATIVLIYWGFIISIRRTTLQIIERANVIHMASWLFQIQLDSSLHSLRGF